jgi:2'-5' RNA ligase
MTKEKYTLQPQEGQIKQASDKAKVKLSPQDPYIEYAIAILPSLEGAQKITDINAKLAKKLVPQGLENKHNKCHVTLYHGAYKAEDLPEISAKLGGIACNIKKLTLNFDDNIVVVGPGRWIDINIKRSDANAEVEQNYKAICNLHSKVVDTFYGYHQRPLERTTMTLEALKDQIAAGNENALKIAKQIQTYGVSGLYELYNPHTTLWYQWPTNSVLKDAVESAKHEVKSGFSCDGWALVIAKLGFNGNIEGEVVGNDLSHHPYAVFPLGQDSTVDQAKELGAKTELDW